MLLIFTKNKTDKTPKLTKIQTNKQPKSTKNKTGKLPNSRNQLQEHPISLELKTNFQLKVYRKAC